MPDDLRIFKMTLKQNGGCSGVLDLIDRLTFNELIEQVNLIILSIAKFDKCLKPCRSSVNIYGTSRQYYFQRVSNST